MNIQTFFRPQIQENFPTYTPSVGWDGKCLKLDSGENLWAPKLSIDWNTLLSNVACYPDAGAILLRDALAKDQKLDRRFIAVGNGSDELIDLLCRLFIEKGDVLLDFSPTFPMFTFFGKLNGAVILDLPRRSDFGIDLQKAKKELGSSKLAFLANPNNPTGTVTSRADIIELLKVGSPLVIDEAYFEFAGQSLIDLVPRFENLIVLRTFSKWAGIAGLRVGWMVANPQVIERINAIKAPYNVNTVAQSVALEVLRNKKLFSVNLRSIQVARDWFVEQVNKLEALIAIPSKASCITVLCKSIKASDIAKELESEGIVVKILPTFLIPNALRISIAPKREMQRVLKALKKIVKETV